MRSFRSTRNISCTFPNQHHVVLIQPSGPTGAVQLVIYLGPFNPLWLLRRPFVVAAVVFHCGQLGVFLGMFLRLDLAVFGGVLNLAIIEVFRVCLRVSCGKCVAD